MFYIGGDCGNSNIELHDIRFSVGNRAEDCYDDLRRQWWGDPESLHLDCWGPVEQVDGFDVSLTTTPPDTTSWSDTTAQSNRTYTYVVVVLYSDGTQSGPASVTAVSADFIRQ